MPAAAGILRKVQTERTQGTGIRSEQVLHRVRIFLLRSLAFKDARGNVGKEEDESVPFVPGYLFAVYLKIALVFFIKKFTAMPGVPRQFFRKALRTNGLSAVL